MEEEKKESARVYCPTCGEIVVKELSLYFPAIVNLMCYNCPQIVERQETDGEDDAKRICSEYWLLVHKQKPVTTAELKKSNRRRRRRAPVMQEEDEKEKEKEKIEKNE